MIKIAKKKENLECVHHSFGTSAKVRVQIVFPAVARRATMQEKRRRDEGEDLGILLAPPDEIYLSFTMFFCSKCKNVDFVAGAGSDSFDPKDIKKLVCKVNKIMRERAGFLEKKPSDVGEATARLALCSGELVCAAKSGTRTRGRIGGFTYTFAE